MAKILFIVNDHPNEAFAIAVARETAKILRRGGNEIAWEKVPARETMLGRAVKGVLPHTPYLEKYTKRETVYWTDSASQYNWRTLLEKNRPDIAYSFHCSKPSAFRGHQDFTIHTDFSSGENPDLQEKLGKEIVLKIVEIKAHYRPIGHRALRKIESAVEKDVMEKYYTLFFKNEPIAKIISI